MIVHTMMGFQVTYWSCSHCRWYQMSNTLQKEREGSKYLHVNSFKISTKVQINLKKTQSHRYITERKQRAEIKGKQVLHMHTDVHQFLYREVVGGGSTSKLSISSCKVPNDLHSLVRVSYGRVCVTTAETDTTNRAKVNTLVFSFSLESKGGQHHIRKILTTGCNSSFNTSCNLKYTSALCDLYFAW